MGIDFSTIGRRVASQTASNVLQKVAGNVKGLITGDGPGFKTTELAKLAEPKNNDVKTFQFPLDVMSDGSTGNYGHYIMFYINEIDNATLRFGGGVAKSGDAHMKKELDNRGIVDFVTPMKVNQKTGKAERLTKKNIDKFESLSDNGGNIPVGLRHAVTSKHTVPNKEAYLASLVGGGGQIVSTKRKATHRLDTAIAMYMPQQLNVTYGARYVDTEISPLGAAAGEIVAKSPVVGTGEVNSVTKAVTILKDKLPDAFRRRLILKGLNLIDGLGITGARESFEIAAGEVITERMELAFKNVNRRVFTYNFKMIPKNKAEADEIRKILYAFKFNMLPEMTRGRQGYTMNFPNTFDIEYKYLDNRNEYLHKVSTCVLENMTVAYGGDRFKTFRPVTGEGAPVVETSVNLAFKELELITRERIAEGF